MVTALDALFYLNRSSSLPVLADYKQQHFRLLKEFDMAAFTYWMVSHDVQHMVAPEIEKLSKTYVKFRDYHMQVVPNGMDTYSSAGVACSWLGERTQNIFKLKIVAHGGPGSFMLGVNVTSDNAAPLGGWFRSFFEGSADNGIEILGCACAADSIQITIP